MQDRSESLSLSDGPRKRSKLTRIRFFQVIGKTYTDGLTRDDVMIVFNNVLEQVNDEVAGYDN